MKYFNKSSKLDYVSYDVRGPVLEEAERMQKKGIDIIKLNTGNPAAFDFKAPNEIINDLPGFAECESFILEINNQNLNWLTFKKIYSIFIS